MSVKKKLYSVLFTSSEYPQHKQINKHVRAIAENYVAHELYKTEKGTLKILEIRELKENRNIRP
jgi:hypothetical protein